MQLRRRFWHREMRQNDLKICKTKNECVVKPPHIKCKRQKEIRRIRKRQRQIWAEKRALGFIELRKPIRHGWFKEIVITHRVENYKNRAAIREVYDKVEKIFWGKTKEEAERKWLHETSKYLINKEIPTISRKQYNRLSHKAKSLCVPFYYMIESRKLKLRYYVKIPKGAYRIKFTKAYITHSKRIDPKLESECALLEQQTLKHGYFEASEKLDKWKDWWKVEETKKRERKTKQNLLGLRNYSINQLLKDEISWERN